MANDTSDIDRNGPKATASGRSSLSPSAHRPIMRAATFGNITSPSGRRNSSLSLDEAKQSFKSSTDDLLLPRARGSGIQMHHQPSHWQSAPLALALLPALGGLFFTNGSAIITDVTLLLLAAVFLNWSVRVPWEWYISTQSIHVDESTSSNGHRKDTIMEESEEEEDNEVRSPASDGRGTPLKRQSQPSQQRASAESELQIHELTALFFCFLSPFIGAWLLHAIRSQLSRPSEGLVSNYNLTIFLLGSELRPLSHLVKMVQSRTLHLQRVVSNNPFEGEQIDEAKMLDMAKRLDELERHVADKSAGGSPSPHVAPASAAQLLGEVRSSFQPELDALNRAVRRYEKRATLLTMQTEARLQDLEARMADAITLAAAAERHQGRSRRGSAGILLDWMCAAVVLPTQTAWMMMSLPARFAVQGLTTIEKFVGKKVRTEMKTAGRTSTGTGHGRTGPGRSQGRGSKKAM